MPCPGNDDHIDDDGDDDASSSMTTTLMMTTTMTMMIYDSWFMIPKMTFWLKAKLGWVGRIQWKVFRTQVRFTSSEHFCHLAFKFTSTFTSSAHFCHLDLHLLHISTHHLGLIQTGKRPNSIIWAERNRQCVCIATLRPCSIYTATNIPENTNYPLCFWGCLPLVGRHVLSYCWDVLKMD